MGHVPRNLIESYQLAQKIARLLKKSNNCWIFFEFKITLYILNYKIKISSLNVILQTVP